MSFIAAQTLKHKLALDYAQLEKGPFAKCLVVLDFQERKQPCASQVCLQPAFIGHGYASNAAAVGRPRDRREHAQNPRADIPRRKLLRHQQQS